MSPTGGLIGVDVVTWRRLNRRRDHVWTQPRISNYVDGELVPEERRRLAAHEEICPDCARLIRMLQVLLAILPPLQLPPGATVEVAKRTAERVRAQIGEWS